MTEREIAEAATKGEWQSIAGDSESEAIYYTVVSEGGVVVADLGTYKNAKADARFITTFHPQRVLALLDEVERLKAIIRNYFPSNAEPFRDYTEDELNS